MTSDSLLSKFRAEWPLATGVATTVLFLLLGKGWLADLSHPFWFICMFGWLFCTILGSAFAVVHHAESLAILVGEPFGTLVLTLTMSGTEMLMITAVMLTGHGGPCTGA